MVSVVSSTKSASASNSYFNRCCNYVRNNKAKVATVLGATVAVAAYAINRNINSEYIKLEQNCTDLPSDIDRCAEMAKRTSRLCFINNPFCRQAKSDFESLIGKVKYMYSEDDCKKAKYDSTYTPLAECNIAASGVKRECNGWENKWQELNEYYCEEAIEKLQKAKDKYDLFAETIKNCSGLKFTETDCKIAATDKVAACFDPSQNCNSATREFEFLLKRAKSLDNFSKNVCEDQSKILTYYKFDCKEKIRHIKYGINSVNRNSRLWDDRLNAISDFKKFQATKPAYDEMEVKCSIPKDESQCVSLGTDKIQKCADNPKSARCKAAETRFEEFIQKSQNDSQNSQNSQGSQGSQNSQGSQSWFDTVYNFFADLITNDDKETPPVKKYLPSFKKRNPDQLLREELQLEEGFTKKECQKAFQQYSLAYHPDKCKDNPDMTLELCEKMKELYRDVAIAYNDNEKCKNKKVIKLRK